MSAACRWETRQRGLGARHDAGASHLYASARTQLDQLALGQVRRSTCWKNISRAIWRREPGDQRRGPHRPRAARGRAAGTRPAAAAGIPAGPLHGLPITIKDTFDVDGMPATSGAPEYAKRPASDADAAAVARLRAAGAVIWGKTNTPYLAGDSQTYNPVHGRSRIRGISEPHTRRQLRRRGRRAGDRHHAAGARLRHWRLAAPARALLWRRRAEAHLRPHADHRACAARPGLARRARSQRGRADGARCRRPAPDVPGADGEQPVAPAARTGLKARRIGVWAEDKAFPVSPPAIQPSNSPPKLRRRRARRFSWPSPRSTASR
jgi:hypothetical protein